MMAELKFIGTYIRAVFWHWWLITIEVILVLADFIERIFGTWLVPGAAAFDFKAADFASS